MSEKEKDAPRIHRNIHPPFVALFYIVVTMVLQRFAPIPFNLSQPIKYVGLGLTFIGFLCGMGAFIEFRKARTTLNPHGSVKALVKGGIFKYSRNPIYLGFLFMVVGFPLTLGSWWGIIAAPFFTTTLSRLVIDKEEAYLEKKFGDAYREYASRVRRWL